MKLIDEAAEENQKLWAYEVEQGCGYCVPWLTLDDVILGHIVSGEIERLPDDLMCLYPKEVFQDVAGKDVLCIASGGRQQTAVFSKLGATVTSVDLTQGQLDGDQVAAAHYGYQVQTIQSDMRDLSMLEDNSFDLVYQANSIAYVPDVQAVYQEVSRVLKPNGLYRIALSQPAIHTIGWDGERYFIEKPYRERVIKRPNGFGIEFRHTLAELLNTLILNNLIIQQLTEAPFPNLPAYVAATPGSWNHERAFVGGEFAIVARKLTQ